MTRKIWQWRKAIPAEDTALIDPPSYTIENEGNQIIWRETEDDGGTIQWRERIPQ